jgi:hypothetical protein
MPADVARDRTRASEEIPVNDTTIRVQVASNYRCREHVECSVTWKGTGCTLCTADRERRQLTRSYDAFDGHFML